jgi:hypothetical protein
MYDAVTSLLSDYKLSDALFSLDIVLSLFLQLQLLITPFGIFKLFLTLKHSLSYAFFLCAVTA